MSETCPTRRELLDFDSGKLPPNRLAAVGEHLESCDQCLAVLDSADVSVGFLKQGGLLKVADDSEEREIQALIQEVDARDTVNLSLDSSLAAKRRRESNDLIRSILAPPESDCELGRLGGYPVSEVLGKGGMGVVFKAYDQNLNRHVALKAMKSTAVETIDEEARLRFLREARTTAAIQHDNIVLIHQVGEDRDIPFIATELLEGETLAQRLDRDKRLTVKESLRIALEITSGLNAANQQGVMHRDIKPSNIWLEKESGRVKILDFGLAATLEDAGNLTRPGAIIGTPNYLSPEQAVGQVVDFRSDLFSLGVVLYEMLTGSRPFERKSLIGILNAIGSEQPPAPGELFEGINDSVSSLVMRLLAKEPNLRMESANLVGEEIRKLIAQEQDPSGKLLPVPRVITAPKKTNRLTRSWLLAIGFFTLIFGLSIFIYIKTDFGVLQIEINDPDTVVTVLGKDIEIKGKGVKKISLRPGKRWIRVKRGDFEFDTEAFQLLRAQKVIVGVVYQKGRLEVVRDGNVVESRKMAVKEKESEQRGITWLEYGSINSALPFDSMKPLTMEATFHAPDTPDEQVALLQMAKDNRILSLVRIPDNRLEIRARLGGKALNHRRTHDPIDFSRDLKVVMVYRPNDSVSLFLNGKLHFVLKDSSAKPVPDSRFGGFAITGVKGTTVDDVRVMTIASPPTDPRRKDSLGEVTLLHLPFNRGVGNVFEDRSVHQRKCYSVGRFAWTAKVDGRWQTIPDPPPTGNFAIKNSGARTIRILLTDLDSARVRTIECQFKATGKSQESKVLQFNWDEYAFTLFRTPDNRLAIQTWAGGKKFRERSVRPFDFSDWRHLALVYSVKKLSLFVDGKLEVELKGLPALSRYSASRRKGLTLSESRQDLSGCCFDELRLSSAIRYWSDFVPEQSFENDKETLALIHFDEGRYNVAFDSSDYSHGVWIEDENAWFKVKD